MTFWVPAYAESRSVSHRRSFPAIVISIRGSIFCDRLRSRSQDRRRSQKCVSKCFHMIAHDRRTFCDLRSSIICDHMETSVISGELKQTRRRRKRERHLKMTLCVSGTSAWDKTKLNIRLHMLTSSTQLQKREFRVVDWERTRTSSKCQYYANMNLS